MTFSRVGIVMDTAGMQAICAKLPLAEAVLEVFRFVGNDARLQAIFDEYRGQTYDNKILFPDLVGLVGAALLEHGGSGNQSFSRARETGELEASKVAAYGKLGRLPIPLSQAFLAEPTHSLRQLFPAQAQRQPPASLRGFRTIIMDGKAIKKVAKRLKLLRKVAGGLLGGRTLVAMEYETGLVIGMHAVEDGDANDVRFVPEILPLIRAEIEGTLLFLADSGFCDLQRMEEYTAGGNHFLIRRHPKVGFHQDLERPVQSGIDAQGRTYFEEWGWLGAVTHPKRRYVRQITLQRPGEPDVALVTDLLDAHTYPAEDLLNHYLQRWGIEQIFQKVTEVFHLQKLIGSTPKATIFQFAFCLLLYNLIQVIRGNIAALQERETETISIENLFVDVHRQLIGWSVLVESGLPLDDIPVASNLEELAARLRHLLQDQWSNRWIKATNKKRRAHQPRPHDRTHGSVYRILNPPPTPKVDPNRSSTTAAKAHSTS
jgi:Transposase DDE domain